ncbi:MAG: hypothetical protein JSV51_02585 [Candidatus Bathyarchaeota archaeon]|nr:MAG: hypothetical protein JSV51_02585 [Candidatus Bathyarchaeota archaeon]
MGDTSLIAGLDVVVQILADSDWKKRAQKVKSLKELQKLLIDFCKAKGRVVRISKNTVCVYASLPSPRGP